MSKITGIFQLIVIGLLLGGAIIFLIQGHYLQFSVYAGFGLLFLGYNLLERKNQKNK